MDGRSNRRNNVSFSIADGAWVSCIMIWERKKKKTKAKNAYGDQSGHLIMTGSPLFVTMDRAAFGLVLTLGSLQFSSVIGSWQSCTTLLLIRANILSVLDDTTVAEDLLGLGTRPIATVQLMVLLKRKFHCKERYEEYKMALRPNTNPFPLKSTLNTLWRSSYVSSVTPNWGDDLKTRAEENKESYFDWC